MHFMLSNWVPHGLTEKNKMQRVTSCRALIQIFNQYRYEFLGSSLFIYRIKPEYTGIQRPAGWQETHHSSSKAHHKKDTALVGFTYHSLILRDSRCPFCYQTPLRVMTQFLKDDVHRFYNLKKNKIKLGKLLLMWNNTMPHVAQGTQAFLTERNVELLKQPAYSPDLNLCDGYLFRKDEHLLKSHDFKDHEHVKDGLQRVAKSLPKDQL